MTESGITCRIPSMAISDCLLAHDCDAFGFLQHQRYALTNGRCILYDIYISVGCSLKHDAVSLEATRMTISAPYSGGRTMRLFTVGGGAGWGRMIPIGIFIINYQ